MSPVIVSEAIELIRKDVGEEPNYHEKIALLQEYAVLKEEEAKKLLSELKKAVPEKSEEFYVKVVDVLPERVETLRLISYHLGEELSEEEEKKVLETVGKYLKE